MSDPFALALDAIFNAPGSEAAEHVSVHGVVTRDVRVIRSRPDQALRFGDGAIIAGTHVIEIRRADVAEPEKGDTLFVGDLDDAGVFTASGEYRLIGEPLSDVEAMTWTIGADAVDPSR